MARLLKLLFLTLISSTLSGCVAVAAIGSKVAPQPPTPAEYKPPKVPTLIFVESYQNPDLYEVEAERVARDVGAYFKEKKSFPVIAMHKVTELRANEGEAFRKMDLPAIARAVGAKQVIYVNLVRFTADPAIGSETNRGEVEAVVKVVDADSGHTLWPRDSSVGRDITYKTPALSVATNVDTDGSGASATSRSEVQQQLYKNLCAQIDHLFADWVDEEQSGNPPDSITGEDLK